jgi:hypothetical protein
MLLRKKHKLIKECVLIDDEELINEGLIDEDKKEDEEEWF